jgi:hypothetical protein
VLVISLARLQINRGFAKLWFDVEHVKDTCYHAARCGSDEKKMAQLKAYLIDLKDEQGLRLLRHGEAWQQRMHSRSTVADCIGVPAACMNCIVLTCMHGHNEFTM